MPKIVGKFRDSKSNTSLLDLPTGGGVGSVFDPRIAAWTGNVQHVLVETLLVSSLGTSGIDSQMLRGLEVSSLNFIQILVSLFPSTLRVRKRHSGGTRALNEHSSLLNVLVLQGFPVSCAFCLAFFCTLLDLGTIQLFGFLRLDPKDGHGQRPILWFGVVWFSLFGLEKLVVLG